MRAVVFMFAMAALALPASAQTAYRSIMPDGRVVIGDKPAPGAARVIEFQLDGSPNITLPREDREASPRPRPAVALPPGKGEKPPAAELRAQEFERAERELREAELRLQAAREARHKGEEPLPGERLGIVGGGSRLSEAYFERQRQLERAEQDAQRRLEDAERRFANARR